MKMPLRRQPGGRGSPWFGSTLAAIALPLLVCAAELASAVDALPVLQLGLATCSEELVIVPSDNVQLSCNGDFFLSNGTIAAVSSIKIASTGSLTLELVTLDAPNVELSSNGTLTVSSALTFTGALSIDVPVEPVSVNSIGTWTDPPNSGVVVVRTRVLEPGAPNGNITSNPQVTFIPNTLTIGGGVLSVSGAIAIYGTATLTQGSVVTLVPEPSSSWMFVAGLLTLGVLASARRPR